jgi:sec-independent protein translocase protein TatB
MFDIGWGEFLVIGIVALIVIGPKELPGVLRTLGQAMTKVRRMAAEFQGQFNEAMREAEMADVKKQIDEATAAARNFQYYDPLNPDGLEPKAAETKPADTEALPAPEEKLALPEPEASSAPALPEPQTSSASAVPEPDTAETPKPDTGRSS